MIGDFLYYSPKNHSPFSETYFNKYIAGHNLILLCICGLFMTHLLSDNYTEIVPLVSSYLAIMAGLYSIATFIFHNHQLDSRDKSLALTVLLLVLVIISIHIVFLGYLVPWETLLKQFSLYFFLLMNPRSCISPKLLLVVALTIVCLTSTFSINSAIRLGTFNGSETPSPLSNSHDTAFVLAILSIWCFIYSCRRDFSRGLSRSLKVASLLLILETLMLRAFGPLLMILLFFMIKVSEIAPSGKLNFKRMLNLSLLLIPPFTFLMLASLSRFSLDTGNSYRFSQNNNLIGNGRLDAWSETLQNLLVRRSTDFWFGTGTGTDLRVISIWKSTRGSHSYILSIFWEYGVLFLLCNLLVFWIYFLRCSFVTRSVIFPVFASSVVTSGLLLGRTIPGLLLALMIISLHRLPSNLQKTNDGK